MRAIRSIIFILVCIALLWLGVSLIRRALTNSNTTTPIQRTSLASYARSDAKAELYADGPVVLNQEHDAFRITVERTQSKIEIINGYDGKVVRQEVYQNNPEGFEAFLKALDTVNFTKGLKTASQDEQGKCPLGTRYSYKLIDGSKEVVNFWSTTCGSGTYQGVRSSTRQLFINQIPTKTFNELMNGLNINT
jgi:hypothetical protein